MLQQSRHDRGTNNCSLVSVEVGGVFDPRALALSQIPSQLLASKSQERPYDAVFSGRVDASETGQSRAAQEPHDHGFSLIVSGMCRQEKTLPGLQAPISKVSTGRLPGKIARELLPLDRLHFKLHTTLLTEPFAKPAALGGEIWLAVVLKMESLKSLPQLSEEMKQSHRVASPAQEQSDSVGLLKSGPDFSKAFYSGQTSSPRVSTDITST